MNKSTIIIQPSPNEAGNACRIPAMVVDFNILVPVRGHLPLIL